jgi:hypothetical protein
LRIIYGLKGTAVKKATSFILVSTLALFAVLGMALTLARASASPRAAVPKSTAGDTYYVDYEGGDDGNDGLSEGAAWKHAPGDPEATGTPDSVDLQPGDTVLFKGGVVYRGYIYLLRVNGAADAPITYKGDGWGEERAIIEGSQPITTAWTLCESQAACGGNPHWQNIYYTDAPAGVDFAQGFFEDDAFIWQAQDPNPGDPFYYDRIEYFRVISHTDPTVYQTRTSITDPRYFTQTDSAAWDGAYVIAWRIPNVTVIRRVTGFDPGTDTIYHEDLGGDIYDDRNSFYAVLNHLRVLDLPGEYVLNEGTERFYVWPLNSDHPDQHAYSVLKHGTGIYGIECSHLVIEGFDVTKFRMGIRAIREPTSHVTIRNNRISLLRANNWYALQVNGEDMLVEGNTVTDCQRAVGILAGGNRVTVRNNFVSRTSRQGIWFMGIENSEILDNRVTDIRGTHSNGISVYLHHQNILMAGNRVWNTNNAMTYHGNHDPNFVNNLIVFNNFFADSVHSWGKGMRGVTILNNTFLKGIFFPSEDQEVVFINNVVDGGGGGDVRSHNVYIGLTWSQQPRYGWAPGPGEIVGWDSVHEQYVPIDPGAVLVDPDGDYRLQPDGPAINAGLDVTSYLPAPGEFSYPGLGADIDGIPRPYGATWDMGVQEYVPDLDLFGRPGDETIYLDWTVNTTDTIESWHIEYYTQTASVFTATDPLSVTRSAVLTEHVRNYDWYTVTLHAMLGETSWLSDTVRVMPTDRFVYLPLVLRGAEGLVLRAQ